MSSGEPGMRNINMDLVRVTEVAAIAASKWVGSGDKIAADKEATEAMRERLNRLDFRARIVIGEGKKDDSYGLFAGEVVGKGPKKNSKIYEIAVDPIEGTRPTVTSGPEALSVREEKSLFETGEYYMNKLAYGPEIASKTKLNIKDPVEANLRKISRALGKKMNQIMVCILDRPRHEKMILEMRKLGVRIKLIQDCDVSGAIAACLPESGIDLLMGVGGAPEAVITACAVKCLRGDFQAQIADVKGKLRSEKVYHLKDLVRGECVFAATGITSGSLLRGVRYTNKGPVTNSVFMRSESGTIRWLMAYHGN